MKKLLCMICWVCILPTAEAQKSYVDSLKAYQKEYVKNHEVVTGTDKKFIQFFPIQSAYRVTARLELLNDKKGFLMRTSGSKTPRYFKYAKLHFQIKGKSYTLTAYQNEALQKDPKYKDLLFIPFTDLTSGEESYGGGRYIEFYKNEIRGNQVQIDFNKAYNPYCVYAKGYNCPIPPRENDIRVAIPAGEKNYAKP